MFISEDEINLFRKTILDRFFANKRNLPWRESHDPYSVFVSEVMLQQTQVERILTIFPKFLTRFPDIEALAQSESADVLQEWVGLGYYRRALSLRLYSRYNRVGIQRNHSKRKGSAGEASWDRAGNSRSNCRFCFQSARRLFGNKYPAGVHPFFLQE